MTYDEDEVCVGHISSSWKNGIVTAPNRIELKLNFISVGSFWSKHWSQFYLKRKSKFAETDFGTGKYTSEKETTLSGEDDSNMSIEWIEMGFFHWYNKNFNE